MKPLDYAKKACDTIMNTFTPETLPPAGFFAYHQGVFLSGMQRTYNLCGDEKYFNYIKDWVDVVTDPDGTIHDVGNDWVSLKTLDFRQPGILMFDLYKKLKNPKYLKIVEYLVESLKNFPKNSVGGFWHMESQPYQMWLDGLYMAGPIMAMYADLTGKQEFFDMAAHQAILMYENMHDEKTGLLYHGWDESKQAQWADKTTGLSANFWGRACGWYVVAIMDIFSYLPSDHKDRSRLEKIEADILKSVITFQGKNGRWFEVLDKPEAPENWEENSCSCLFVYAISKAVRKGVLPAEYKKYADMGYEGVINSLKYDGDGNMLIGDICIGTCIDEGTYEHYINRETVVNDLHGSGAFVLMCSEYAKL